MFYKSVLSYCLVCDVIPLLVDSHIVGVGKPIFGRNREPIVVLASGHFYNWLEVAANYYTSQIALTSVKNQSYREYVCDVSVSLCFLIVFLYTCICIYFHAFDLCMIHVYVCACVCMCVCVCNYVCMCVYLCAYVFVCIMSIACITHQPTLEDRKYIQYHAARYVTNNYSPYVSLYVS